MACVSLLATSGYLPDGLPVLRELVAQHYADRGLPTHPGQIIVTNGAMGAISLLARTLLSPGDRVLVEGSSYPHAHDAFVAAGGRLSPLPVGGSPWDTEAMSTTLAAGRHPEGRPAGHVEAEHQRAGRGIEHDDPRRAAQA